MAEALVIAGFLGLLVVLQVKDQKKIIVAAQTSWIRMGLSIALTVAILVIFWPSNLADKIKLGAFAAIILINGFLKEGLSQEGVVKLGVLNGEFARYPQIQIEELAVATLLFPSTRVRIILSPWSLANRKLRWWRLYNNWPLIQSWFWVKWRMRNVRLQRGVPDDLRSTSWSDPI